MNCKKIITIVIITIIAMSSIILEISAKEVNTASFTLMPGSSRISPVYGFVTKTGPFGNPIAAPNVTVQIYFVQENGNETQVNVVTDQNGYYFMPFQVNPDDYKHFYLIVQYLHYSPLYPYTGGHRVDIRLDKVM